MVTLLSERECLLPRAQYLNAIKVELDNRHKGIFYSLKGKKDGIIKIKVTLSSGH